MSADLLWLVLAGVGAGLVGSMTGLASLISYPALLAAGLPPLVANVTNTVSLFGITVGSVAGSQRELAGQGARLVRLIPVTAVGGAIGAALLLSAPAGVFELVVPWMVLLGAVLLLLRDRIRVWSARHSDPHSLQPDPHARRRRGAWFVALLAMGIYGGYFGAGAGVIALALLSLERVEPLAVTNAVKNVATGAANAAGSIGYVLLAPVDYRAAVAVMVGSVIGAFVGPAVVRVVPETPMRWAVGVCGMGLALYLAAGALG
ncbi:sulfite exporter TauE/SafE family protein [Janibacter melonis]|uniref:sulfite exporter TauE/SafE family protein n=1 Tax=Janibacter melonis TaxID=262209 RepID=UPI001E43DABD|nr:sulfite exporter TauE/SafE family protein [Janibacter melonis]MCB5991398.1 sulfite exporter TauE/SafE family protein [Janibacter melonis]